MATMLSAREGQVEPGADVSAETSCSTWFCFRVSAETSVCSRPCTTSRPRSSARRTRSASSGASTISSFTIPPGRSRRRTLRSSGASASSGPSAQRYPRQSRSSCAPVATTATSSSFASVSGVATRVSARAFAYDSLPTRRASSITNSLPNARATRTFSRAVAESSPIRQASQCAHEAAPSTTTHRPRRIAGCRSAACA